MLTTDKKAIIHFTKVAHEKGIEHVVVSPGSRNAPLVIAFSRSGKFQMHTIVDERVAAFYAMGMAQQTQKPVIIICTSGTAALNYAPAIAEAYYQKIPLLVCTADRPSEWIDQMDGQTIRQRNIYQNYIKASFEIPTEPSNESEFWHAHRIFCEGTERCILPEPGPVHINFPFREPLYDLKESEGTTLDYPIFKNIVTQLELDASAIEELQNVWKASDKILIVSGLLNPNDKLNQVIASISELPQVAILTETTSNIQGEGFNRSIDRLIETINHLENKKEFIPDLLITLGGPVVSKKIKAFLRQNQPKVHWHINASNDFVDTYKSLSRIIPVSPEKGLKIFDGLSKESNYRKLWLNADQKLTDLFYKYLQNLEFSDLKAFDAILSNLPKNSILHLGNSTAVRYSNLFNHCSDRNIFSYSNRGTSGIDGTISTAVGGARVSSVPNTLIIGDISFLYDSNALWIKNFPKNLTIFVINNGGGNIFRIIDGPSKIDELEEFFETQQDVNIEKLCEAFGLKHKKTSEEEELNSFMKEIRFNEFQIIEIITDSKINPITLKNYFNFLKKYY
jgi:2-succinyl-5-enolpyruvyl-6-hydroxy-3-cyclohexene-1-carboxylate synthase